jgi:hypothetical protein
MQRHPITELNVLELLAEIGGTSQQPIYFFNNRRRRAVNQRNCHLQLPPARQPVLFFAARITF